ncbi:MAG: hypothetical protein H6Q67_394 [Firmicutes bacterium]|nr:hypothetical protein [Bacillota bacterium]
MTPKEIIARLSLLRVKITDRTLYNYAEQNLIPTPKRGSGRSGKWVDYPDNAMAEAYAAWRLLHGDYWQAHNYVAIGLKPQKLAPETVAAVRRLKAEIEMQDWSSFKREPANFEESVKFILMVHRADDEAASILLSGYIKLWELFKSEAEWRVREILDDPEY